MKKTLSTLTLAAIVAFSLSACTINITVPPSFGPQMMGGMNSSNTAVEMFAEGMIPHHQQAIDMSNLALTHSTSPEILDLARRIIAGQTPEIELMQGWLDDNDSDSMMGMMGETGMGGMASDAEMAELGSLSGSDFDRQFLTLMITHHEGALHMVHMIDDSTEPEVKGLAQDIVRVQTAEIKEMKQLLEAVPNA